MRKYVFACALLLLLDVSLAHAAGVNLRWNECSGEGTGAINNNFACGTNAGTHLLVGSFNLDADANQIAHLDGIVDLASASAALPAWWEFKNLGTCRTSSLGLNGTAGVSYTVCEDWSVGQASGAIVAYTVGTRGANTARVLLSVSVPPAALQNLAGGTEYFAFNLTLNNIATIGAGSCGGCATPVCIVLNSLKLVRGDETVAQTLTMPGNGTDSQYATWQGGGNPTVGTVSGCPAATPTRSTTWGAVKRMYR